MKTIVKFTAFNQHKLNNAEYTNFSTRTLALINAATPAALGLEDADVARYTDLLATMSELVAMSRVSDETAELSALDKERDDLGVYIMTTVRNGRKVSAMSAAATRLYNLLKPYTGFQKLPNQQETATVNGMVTDLRKAAYTADVALLGLTTLVDALATANARYEELTAERTASRMASKIDNSKTVRTEMDVLYDYFQTVSLAYSIVTPTAATATFIASMNALIEEVNALYNQRTGNSGGASSSTSGGDGSSDNGGSDTPPADDGGGGTTPDSGGGSDSGGDNNSGDADFN